MRKNSGATIWIHLGWESSLFPDGPETHGHMSIVYDILGLVENSAKLGHFVVLIVHFVRERKTLTLVLWFLLMASEEDDTIRDKHF